MNKNKKTAIATAFLALCASFAFWTYRIDDVWLPSVPQAAKVQIETLLSTIFHKSRDEKISTKKEVQATEHIENLGSHFAEHSTVSPLKASIVPIQEKVEPEITQDEPVIQNTENDDEIVHAAAPSELDQWELQRVWSISVPTLGIRAPVLLPSLKYWSSHAWNLMEEQMQVGLNYGTVAYPHSTVPGGMGSLIIAGHSSPPTLSAEKSVYGDVFATLPDIEIGEDVTIASGGNVITYTVEDKIIVKPSEVSILEQQSDESVLKLITCYPVGTTKNRMIIIAKKTTE